MGKEPLMDKESSFEITADQLDDVKPLDEIFDLQGKVAVVTGTVGLALHVINRLSEAGAKVVFSGRSEEWGRLSEEALRSLGRDVTYFQGDVTKTEDCYAIVGFAEKTYGNVDIVVPVAATWSARSFVDMKPEEFQRIIDVGLTGQYFTVQAAARSMIRGGNGGKIVMVASVAWRGDDMPSMAMMTSYNAAKGGVVAVAKGIAKELKQYGINTNCVAPGGMLTPGAILNMQEPSELYGKEWTKAVEEKGAVTPLCSSPDEVALVILAMCTEMSDFMYGQTIEVDGGSQFSFQNKPWSYTMEGGVPGPEKQ